MSFDCSFSDKVSLIGLIPKLIPLGHLLLETGSLRAVRSWNKDAAGAHYKMQANIKKGNLR